MDYHVSIDKFKIDYSTLELACKGASMTVLLNKCKDSKIIIKHKRKKIFKGNYYKLVQTFRQFPLAQIEAQWIASQYIESKNQEVNKLQNRSCKSATL